MMLTGGGIIPDEDAVVLKQMGVGKLFMPGTNTHEIADYIQAWVKKNRNF
jgi:methylmalonyl-CoA mutase, C-terminal domain